MLVADKDVSFTLTGVGDVIAPHDGIMAAGSGGGFARGGYPPSRLTNAVSRAWWYDSCACL